MISKRRQRRFSAAIGAALLAALGGGPVLALRAAAGGTVMRSPQAHAAHALRATDTAHLHFVSAAGALLYESGRASGTLPGSMRVRLRLGATLSGSFTIYTRGGSITGHGAATPHGSGTYESFAGSLVATGGSGRYRHAHGHAQLYGTFNRKSYALVVQTAGTLFY